MKDDSTAPLWGAWLQLPTVQLWQAVALSIGREPTEPLPGAIFKGYAPDERTGAHVFELRKRWRYCEQALLNSDGPIKPRGYGIANPPVCPVLLADVAAFLTRAGFELPEEMRALVPVTATAEPRAEPAAVKAESAAIPPGGAADRAEHHGPRGGPLRHLQSGGASGDAMERIKVRLTLPADSFIPVARIESLLWTALEAAGRAEEAGFDWGFEMDPKYFAAIMQRWRDEGKLSVFRAAGLGPLASDGDALNGVLRREDFAALVTAEFPGFEVVNAEPAPAGAAGRAEAIDAPSNTPPQRKKRMGWQDVARDYVIGRIRAGKFATCEDLYDALFKEAGLPDSPFTQGINKYRGQLFVSELSKPLALKSMRNAWGELQVAAKKN